MNPKSLVQNIHTLFSLPDVVIRINEMIDDPKVQTTELAQVILYDPGLAARLLRLANSAYYNPRRRIETVSNAVVMLGYRELRDLVMTTVSVNLFKGLPPELVNMDRFWLHSIRSGAAARKLAYLCHLREGERFFLIGLLHGIGKLVFYSQFPERYREVLDLASDDEQIRTAAERQVFRFTYAELSAELLKSWRLFGQLHTAITYHLEPDKAPSDCRIEATILHIAVRIANSLPANPAAPVAPLDSSALSHFASLAESIHLNAHSLTTLPVEIDAHAKEIFAILRPDATQLLNDISRRAI